MSISAIDRVWRYSQQSGTALLVLLALADWADDWGYCYPGHATTARKARTTERNVYLLINKLAESGEIRIVRKGSGGRYQRETSVYQVTVGMSEEEIEQSESQSPIAREVFSTPEKFSPEKFSPENISPENISPEKSCNALNVLINRQLNAAVNFNFKQQHLNLTDGSPEKFSPEKFSGDESITENQCIPEEIREKLTRLGWRGPLKDVEMAWREDAERVRQWLWYARKQGWSGALLRTVLRNPGEYPPELDPDSELSRRRYIEGPYAEFIEH